MTNWNHKIHVGRPYDPETGNFSEHRDSTVKVIRDSAWLRGSQYSWELSDLVNELAAAEDIDTFDTVMDGIYGLADQDRCWIEAEPW